jgi:hypothetical protein
MEQKGPWVVSLRTVVFLVCMHMCAILTGSHAEIRIEGTNVASLCFAPGGAALVGMGSHSLSERSLLDVVSLRVLLGWISFWSTGTGELARSIAFPKHAWPQQFSISRNGRYVAVTFFESQPRDQGPEGLGCYSLAENKWLWKWKWSRGELTGRPKAVVFLPDNKRILVLDLCNVFYYEAETGQKVWEHKGLLRDYPVWRKALRTSFVSPSGRLLVIWQEKPWEGRASEAINKYVTVWDLTTGKEIARWEKPKYECRIATFSPDEENVIFGCKDGYVREWSIKARTVTRELKETAGVYSVAFSPDGRLLAVNSGIRDVTVFDFARQREIRQFPGAGKNYGIVGTEQYPMAFSPDGKLFALLDEGKLCLYSTSTWEQKWCVDPKPPNVPHD